MGGRESVVLVGREQPGDENLALRYLAAALLAAGHRPTIVPLSGPPSLPGAVHAALAAGPALVGLSISDADIAIDTLAFARLLRKRGFGGHITAGGALATLARHELLGRHVDIDSVIRHEGEVPLVELADRIAAGRGWHDVPGITTGNGDGPPARVTDPTPLTLQPLHPDPLPRLVGVPMARIVASRGCPGRCRYCGPAALQRSALAEAARAGLGPARILDAGVGGTRRRAPADVASEVAELYHGRGARFFHVLDDNLLSTSQGAAKTWLRSFLAELRTRQVGRSAWSLQVEPASLDDEVVELLTELGVIRLAVGVEALTHRQLRAIGRDGDVDHNQALLARLRDSGIVSVMNSLIVHPESSAESISAELDALGNLRGVHYDALAVAVYPGTALHESLLRSGSVSGGMLGLRFEPSDEVVARFRAALIHLRLQATGRYGPMVMAHDVAVNVALARHLELPGYEPRLDRALQRSLNELNAKRVAAWRQALAIAQLELPRTHRIQSLLALTNQHRSELATIWSDLADIQRQLDAAESEQPRRGGRLVAAALAAGFTFCLVPAACGGVTQDESSPHEPVPDAAPPDVGVADAPVDVGVTDVTAVDAPADGDGSDAPPCSAEDYWEQSLAVEDPGLCFSSDSCGPYGITLDAEGRAVDVVGSPGTQVPAEIRECYLDALGGEVFPCLAGETIWQECVICLF